MAAEEMGFDSRQTQGELVLAKSRHGFRVRQQCRAGPLIDTPGARRRHVDARVWVEQAAAVGGQYVPSLGPRQKLREGAPSLGKDPAHAIKKPVDLLLPAEKNSAQDEPGAAPGVGRGIIKRQCRAPGAAKDEPSFEAEQGAQALDVGHEMCRGVILDLAKRGRPAGAALIENDDPPIIGIEKPTVNRGGAGTGAAVQKQHRRAARVAQLFPIHRVAGIQPQGAHPVRVDRRIEVWAVNHREAVRGFLHRLCPAARFGSTTAAPLQLARVEAFAAAKDGARFPVHGKILAKTGFGTLEYRFDPAKSLESRGSSGKFPKRPNTELNRPNSEGFEPQLGSTRELRVYRV